MRKTLLILLLCSVVLAVQGQQLNPKDNTKYWYYRYRLKTQFLREGLDDFSCNSVSGFSLPAERTFSERK